MVADNGAHVLRGADPSEGGKFSNVDFIGATCFGIDAVREPFQFRWHSRHHIKFILGEFAVAGRVVLVIVGSFLLVVLQT